MPGFQSFSGIFALFRNGQISHQQHKGLRGNWLSAVVLCHMQPHTDGGRLFSTQDLSLEFHFYVCNVSLELSAPVVSRASGNMFVHLINYVYVHKTLICVILFI